MSVYMATSWGATLIPRRAYSSALHAGKLSATATLRLPGKIEPARVVLLQGQRGLGLLQGLVVFSQFLEPHGRRRGAPAAFCLVLGWPDLYPNRRSSPPCTSRPPANSAREENARPWPCCSRCRRGPVCSLIASEKFSMASVFSHQRNLALPQRVQDVHVAGQFLLENLQVIDGIRASSLGHGSPDQFPPHLLDRWPRPADLAFPALAPILPALSRPR